MEAQKEERKDSGDEVEEGEKGKHHDLANESNKSTEQENTNEKFPNNLFQAENFVNTQDEHENAMEKKHNFATVPSLLTLPPEETPNPFPDRAKGAALFQKMSWQRLAVCLICEAIALGVLSLPKAFATLGMFPGIVSTVIVGIMTTYTALIVGEMKCRYPQISTYPDLAKMMFGKIGYVIVAIMMTGLLVLSTGSHVLTGIMAFQAFSSHSICSVYFGLLSAFLLFVFGLPKTFHRMAILAYIDFASITAAVLVAIVTASIESGKKPGGLAATEWYWFVPGNGKSNFVGCTIALTNIALAYAFVHCLPSFMSELHRPIDYRKSVITLGGFQIVLYTLIGSTLYFLKGVEVKDMSLQSLDPKMQKVVFGLALPVIFISGSINSHTAARFVYNHIFTVDSIHRYINTGMGYSIWLALNGSIALIAFLSAEVIPSFPTFLGLKAALFSACFSFTFPAIMFFKFIRYESKRCINLKMMYSESIANVLIFCFGAFMFFVGSSCVGYSLIHQYKQGNASPFAC